MREEKPQASWGLEGPSAFFKAAWGEPVHLTDLKLAAFEDPERARDVADDCLRLFEKGANENFSACRSASWYERLWLTIASGDPRRRAQDASSADEAQRLLWRLLQAHASTNAKSNALVALLARRLRNLRPEDNEIAQAIISMAQKILRLEKILPGATAVPVVNAGHRSTWQQNERLLLYKTMVIAAAADGYLAPEEEVFLEHKLRELDLDAQHSALAHTFEATPHPIDEELAAVESYPIRLSIYRHAMAVVYSDGIFDPQERAYMERLRRVLDLEFRDSEKIKNAFVSFQKQISPQKIVALFYRQKPADPSHVLPGRLEQFDQISPLWIDYTARLLAEAMSAPILQRFEQYGDQDNVPVVVFIETLDPAGIGKAVQRTATRVRDMARSLVADVHGEFAIPDDFPRRLDDLWDGLLAEAETLDTIATELVAAGDAIRRALPETVPSIARALGFAGAARQGPLGWAASIISGELAGAESRRALEAAASRWDAAVNQLANATHRWQSSGEERLRNQLAATVSNLRSQIQKSAAAGNASFPLRRMLEHMEEVCDSRGDPLPEVESRQCPRCGRSYPAEARRCAICEVDL